MLCPTCKIEFELEASSAKPFCSKRCKEIDLGRWLDGAYTLAAGPDADPDEIAEDNWAGNQITDADATDTDTADLDDELGHG